MTHEFKTVCHFCGAEHDATTDSAGNDSKPENGDITICIKCGEWAIIDDVPGNIRKPTEEEYAMIRDNPQAREARGAWLAVFGKRRGETLQ